MVSEDQIANSYIFVSIVSNHYLKDAHCLSQLERARSLKKPVLHVVFEGTDLPEGFSREGEVVMLNVSLTDENDCEKVVHKIKEMVDEAAAMEGQ